MSKLNYRKSFTITWCIEFICLCSKVFHSECSLFLDFLKKTEILVVFISFNLAKTNHLWVYFKFSCFIHLQNTAYRLICLENRNLFETMNPLKPVHCFKFLRSCLPNSFQLFWRVLHSLLVQLCVTKASISFIKTIIYSTCTKGRYSVLSHWDIHVTSWLTASSLCICNWRQWSSFYWEVLDTLASNGWSLYINWRYSRIKVIQTIRYKTSP